MEVTPASAASSTAAASASTAAASASGPAASTAAAGPGDGGVAVDSLVERGDLGLVEGEDRHEEHVLVLVLKEVVVILGYGTLPLVHLGGGVPLGQGSYHTTGSLNSKGQGCHIEQEQVRDRLGGDPGQDGGLDSGTVGDSFVRVEGLVQLLAVEEVLGQLLELGNYKPNDKGDVGDEALSHLSVSHGLFQGLEGALKQVEAELPAPGLGDGGVAVESLEGRGDLDVSLSRGGRGPLVLVLELVDEVINHPVIDVLASQVSISGSGLHLKDALLDGQDGDVKGTTTEIEDGHVALCSSLLPVQAVGDGCSIRLVIVFHLELGQRTGVDDVKGWGHCGEGTAVEGLRWGACGACGSRQ